MTREFLEKLGLEKDVIGEIMKEHGKSIQSAKPEDYDDLKNQNATLEKELQDLQSAIANKDEKYKELETSISNLTSQVKTYETKELKLRVAHENQIPFELADRLSGESEEDIKKDAERLSAFVAKKNILPLKEETKSDSNPYKDLLNNLTK